MHWTILLAAVPSLLITWVAVPMVRKRASRWDVVARPRADRFHDQRIPTGGGIAIWLGVIVTFSAITVLLWLLHNDVIPTSILPSWVQTHLSGLIHQSPKLWALLAAATGMMVLGLIDDCSELDWRLRMAVQTCIAVLIVAQGWRLTLFVEAPVLTLLLSVVWIVGIVNSFNLLDNMDGLAAGVAWIATVILAAVMLLAPDPESSGPQLFVAGFLLVLAGSLAGFWWHNRPPATIFMGDAGSYFVGFCLATATLMATFAGGDVPRHAVFAPLCVLAVPIYDTLSVVVIRLRAGRSPWAGDTNHFSHRLVRRGLSPPQAVGTVYLLSAACGFGALLLHQVNSWGAVVVLLMVACSLATIGILESTGRR